MTSLMRVAAVIAVVAVTGTAAFYAFGVWPNIGVRLTPNHISTPVPAQTPAPSERSASMLPELGLPGMRPDEPAGEYGWSSTTVGSGMHKVVQDGSDSRQTQLTFAVAEDCFSYGTDSDPVQVRVAGLDGLYVEPYEDPEVLFVNRGSRGQETTGAYALAIGDRTLCVYLTWDPNTTQDELEAAQQVVDSIRGQPIGSKGIRINFTLPEGWDTG